MQKFIMLFSLGGAGYCTLELLWRGRTHWTMFVLGGVCLYLLFTLFHYLDNTPIIFKAFLGGLVITSAEFVTGCIVNLYLGWNVWDYAMSPYNLLGQVCLGYSILWIILSIPLALLEKLFRQYIR